MEQKLCPTCSGLILTGNNYCPNCGYSLKSGPPTLVRQFGLYLLCVLLPPWGLFPAIGLLRRPDGASKKVAYIAILLTIIATIITIYISFMVVNMASSTINRQLNLEPLGL